MVAVNTWLAQLGTSNTGAASAGADVANRADSPERLTAVRIVGAIVLVAIIVLFAKMKMDRG